MVNPVRRSHRSPPAEYPTLPRIQRRHQLPISRMALGVDLGLDLGRKQNPCRRQRAAHPSWQR
jgi:hypothetical protein